MTQRNSSQHNQERDRAIDGYIQALDRGDLETIAVILEQAAHDPELDLLLHEINAALYIEAELEEFATNAEQVRLLARQHLRSAFVDEAELNATNERPLTVGEVVYRLQYENHIPAPDVDISRVLRTSDIELPDELTSRSINALAQQIGVTASGRFWRAFREAAIMLGLRSSQAQAGLAAARTRNSSVGKANQRPQKSDAVTNPRASLGRHAILEAITKMYEATGTDFDFSTPQIVPLDNLIAAHALRAIEVTDLTRQSAARELAARSGQNVMVPEEENVQLAGFLYAWPYRSVVQGCLLVEQRDLVERRRFSVAHELGHYVLHFCPKIQAEREQGWRLTISEGLSYRDQVDQPEDALPDGAVRFTRGTDTHLGELLGDVVKLEQEANQFAAELLMPEPAVRVLVARYGGRASARRLATEFLVSEAAMRWRLKNLGLAS